LLLYEWARCYQLITHHKDICDNAINSQFGRRLFPEDLGQLLDRHQLGEVLLGDIRPGGGPGHRALGLLHLKVVVAAAHVRAPIVGVVGGVAGLVLLPVQLPALQGRLTGVRLALGTRVAHFAEDLADPTSTQLVLGQWKRTTKGHKKAKRRFALEMAMGRTNLIRKAQQVQERDRFGQRNNCAASRNLL